MGQYADALLRQVRALEGELEKVNSQLAEARWNYDQVIDENRLGIASAVDLAKSSFLLARAIFRAVPKEYVVVEYASRLKGIYDELLDVGIEVD
ncbi:MAG: hypothetical protein IJ087_10330 [Eggerthellaceae bacterium]|nr:hypothetical protein [Eggerthellaceae bacterium]